MPPPPARRASASRRSARPPTSRHRRWCPCSGYAEGALNWPRPQAIVAAMKKLPFRLSALQVQWLMVVGFLTVGYAIYLRYLAVENSQVALACDAGLQTWLCKTRLTATWLFRNNVFGGAAMVIAVLHVLRPSIVTL